MLNTVLSHWLTWLMATAVMSLIWRARFHALKKAFIRGDMTSIEDDFLACCLLPSLIAGCVMSFIVTLLMQIGGLF